MYRFENPEYLTLLWLLPAMFFLFVVYRFWQRRKAQSWGDAELFRKMTSGVSTVRPWLKTAYLLTALGLLIIALANPQVGIRLETVKRQGVDLVFALDVSSSMLAEDITPNRLEKAKYVISKSLDQLTGDRVGIIAYAGGAYPLLPITTDYGAAKMSLSSASPDFIPTPGTSLDQAMEYSLKYFDPETPTGKVLVIMSDGEDHEDNWRTAAEELKARGIAVLSMGFGTAQGGPIPVKQGGTFLGYKKDRNHEVVITRLNDEVLRDIALQTNGSYVDGSNTSKALKQLENTLSGLTKAEFEEQVYTDYDDQFQWFLMGALFFLLLDMVTLNKRSNLMERLGIKAREA